MRASAGMTGAFACEHESNALPSTPATALGSRCQQRAAAEVRVSQQGDDETEPMTRLFGAAAVGAAPAREQPGVPPVKVRSKVRLVAAVALAIACLGAGAWMMR
jgi:hypothetical protein